CDVIQGEVQKWEAGTRIPTAEEMDKLADVLTLDCHSLTGAEVGSAVYRNPLTVGQQAELDHLYWASKERIPDIADRFGLYTATVTMLVSPLYAGVSCERCGTAKTFRTRGDRSRRWSRCPSCARPMRSWDPCTGRIPGVDEISGGTRL
ncbi:MAG: hypothetical protein ACYCZV_09730, partial [Acidimicrobiales bacterium]